MEKLGVILKKQKETTRSITTEFHIFVEKGKKLSERSPCTVNRQNEKVVIKFLQENKNYTYEGSLYHFGSQLCIESLNDEDDSFAVDLMISMYISRLLGKNFAEIVIKE